jgi:hypothetical protein
MMFLLAMLLHGMRSLYYTTAAVPRPGRAVDGQDVVDGQGAIDGKPAKLPSDVAESDVLLVGGLTRPHAAIDAAGQSLSDPRRR